MLYNSKKLQEIINFQNYILKKYKIKEKNKLFNTGLLIPINNIELNKFKMNKLRSNIKV